MAIFIQFPKSLILLTGLVADHHALAGKDKNGICLVQTNEQFY